MPKVSVIIPAYGHADLILQTLNSVLKQTFFDYEIIVINDGSPDHTSDVLKPLIESKSIRYLEQENQGVASARKLGIANARGEYIAFLDDDDTWPPDKLEWQVDCLDHDIDLGLIGGIWIGTNGNPGFSFRKEWEINVNFNSFFQRNPFISPGQTLIRLSSLIQAGGIDSEIWGTDDLDLMMRIAYVSKIKVLPKIALNYRIHPGNASNNMERLAANFIRVIEKNIGLAPRGEHHSLKLASWRWVYTWTGIKLLEKFWRSVGSLQYKDARSSIASLRVYGSALLIYPEIREMFLKESYRVMRRERVISSIAKNLKVRLKTSIVLLS